MTISTEAIKAGPFAGNASTTTFSFSYKVFAQADLAIVFTNSSGVESTKTLTTDYSVSLNADQDNSPGGSITTTGVWSPIAVGEKITILNEPNYTQGTDLVSGGGFFPNVIEDALDRSTILARRADEKVTRSIQIPVSDSAGTTVELPSNTLRANKAVVFDADGDVGVSVDNYVDQITTVAASATAAATSAAASSTSATASATSATASATSATAAATSYDNFDDRFLGAKSSDPSTDNDGSSLLTGCLYFNSSTNVMMVYTGSAWVRTTPTSSDQTNINTLSAGAVITDMDLLGTSANVTAMGLLGTSDAVADLNTLGTADVVTDLNTLATGANVTAMGLLGNSTTVSNMGLLGTSAVVTDLSILGTADVVSDLNTLGSADVVSDLNTLGTADVVSDLNTLATGANVTAMGVLGTAANVTAMSNVSGSIANVNTTASNIANVNIVGAGITNVDNFANRYRVASSAPGTSLTQGDLYFNTTTNEMSSYGTSWQAVAISAANQANINICAGDIVFTEDLGNIVDAVSTSTGSDISTVAGAIANINLLAPAAVIADMALLADSVVITDMALLAIPAVIDDMALLAIPAVIDDMALLALPSVITDLDLIGATGVIGNIATVATNLANVDRYAQEYIISSSAPTSPTPTIGDLWMDTTANVLKYHNGSAFVAISAGIANVLADSSPALGGNLDCNDRNLTECGTISGDNLQIDFGGLI